MNLKLRPATPADAQTCGAIVFSAFAAMSDKHSFPRDIPAPEAGVGLLQMLTNTPGFFGVVAEVDGKIVGSNFLDERSPIAGIGPITIDPNHQDKSVGRELMRAVIDRVNEKQYAGVRLVQAAWHGRSLSLYTKLGFVVREPLAVMQGNPIGKTIAGCEVRPAKQSDLDACNELCSTIHGHHRGGELSGSIEHDSAVVVERHGRITGYSTLVGFFGHTVGETNDDVKAILAAAPAFQGPGFLLPIRNTDLFRWCLDNGLRVIQPMTLMSIGLYNEPAGAFLPSILY
ncbi:MAG: GNAT family N-acetyltransferase [Anaerolineae bacterium]|nr:GNAT family N-acetyltransferase [Phycisphaerae bacterium]